MIIVSVLGSYCMFYVKSGPSLARTALLLAARLTTTALEYLSILAHITRRCGTNQTSCS